jgi:predicted esterase
MILLHGRGGSPQELFQLARAFECSGCTYLAPQAAGSTWYPNTFLAPREQNEPWLSSALRRVGELVAEVESAGIPTTRIALLGFSQGACLALEYAARHPIRYGAVIGLSGGLIGAPGEIRNYPGSLDGTPVLLGCSDVDAHIPLSRLKETDEILRAMGASVDLRIYPGMAHTINQEEVDLTRALLDAIAEN